MIRFIPGPPRVKTCITGPHLRLPAEASGSQFAVIVEHRSHPAWLPVRLAPHSEDIGAATLQHPHRLKKAPLSPIAFGMFDALLEHGTGVLEALGEAFVYAG